MQFAVLVAFGQDCLGLWLQTWTPCRGSHRNFELNGTIPENTLVYASSFSLIHHQDICGEQQPAPGRCSRFVIEGLGELMVAKLAFTAFITPALTLLLSLPRVRGAMEAAKAWLRRGRPQGEEAETAPSMSGDTELAGVVMLMDLALIFGFAIPLLLPLLCVAFAAQLAVFHLCTTRFGMTMEYHARPACRYLAVSVLLGSGLNVWFFVDNGSQVVGEAFVVWGVPVGLCLGLAAGVVWHRAACARRGGSSESCARDLPADAPQLVGKCQGPCQGEDASIFPLRMLHALCVCR